MPKRVLGGASLRRWAAVGGPPSSPQGSQFDQAVKTDGLPAAKHELTAEVESMFSQLLDFLPARIFWKDRQFRYVGCNAAFAADAGVRPVDIIGKNDFELPWAAQADLYRADDLVVLEEGIALEGYTEPVQIADESIVMVRTTKFPLLDRKGDIAGVVGFFEPLHQRGAASG